MCPHAILQLPGLILQLQPTVPLAASPWPGWVPKGQEHQTAAIPCSEAACPSSEQPHYSLQQSAPAQAGGMERGMGGWSQAGSRAGSIWVDEGRCQQSREGVDGIWATRDCSCPGSGCSKTSFAQEAGSCPRCRMSHRRDG